MATAATASYSTSASSTSLHARVAAAMLTTTIKTTTATTTTTTTTSTATPAPSPAGAARRLPRLLHAESRGPSPFQPFQSQVKMALHQQLLSAGERRRNVNMKHAFHDVAHQENNAPKSMKVFKGEAKDMLYGIFTMLLLRFFLALAIVLGAIGAIGLLVLLLQHPETAVLQFVRSVFRF